jgi:tripeptidyl-peptidase-1
MREYRTSLIYPQEVILYQVDDQLYEPAEVATTNLFNTFLDALDGVSRQKRTSFKDNY